MSKPNCNYLSIGQAGTGHIRWITAQRWIAEQFEVTIRNRVRLFCTSSRRSPTKPAKATATTSRPSRLAAVAFCLLLSFILHPSSSFGSLLTVSLTNAVTGGPETNYVAVIPLNDNNPVLADGSIVTKGLAARAYPDTNGLLTIYRGPGFYALTNRSIAVIYRFNDLSSNATATIQSGWNTYGPSTVTITTGTDTNTVNALAAAQAQSATNGLVTQLNNGTITPSNAVHAQTADIATAANTATQASVDANSRPLTSLLATNGNGSGLSNLNGTNVTGTLTNNTTGLASGLSAPLQSSNLPPGVVTTNQLRQPDIGPTAIQPVTNVFWGDSLTAGVGTTSFGFPEQIANALGIHCLNMGVSGASSSGIYTDLGAAAFTNFPQYYGLPTVIWAGNNDGISASNTTSLNISNMVYSLTTTNFIVVGIDGNTNQTMAYMQQVLAYNQYLKSIYTNHFLDPILTLSNANNGSVADLFYASNHWTPVSLLYDNIHLNTNGYSVIAREILKSIYFQNMGSPVTRADVLNDAYRLIKDPPLIFTSELGGSGLSDGLWFDCPLGQTNLSNIWYDRSHNGAIGRPSSAVFQPVSSPDGIGLETMTVTASAVDFDAKWFQRPLTNFTFDILAINTNAFNGYFALNSAGTGNPAFQWNLNTNGNAILAKFVSGGANKFVNGTCPFSVYDGLWHQYTFTYDGATERVYADGVEVGNAANTGVPDVPTNSTYWIFGNTNGKGVGIAHPRIWTRALGANEIEQLAIQRGLKNRALTVNTIAPAGITNGLSQIWNSNGVVYLRSSTIGSASSTDTKLSP